jgi:CBS domain-containing protein
VARAAVARFRETLRDWVHGADPQGPMHLAIFFDATAWPATPLLAQARNHLDQHAHRQRRQYLARFAAAADQFQEPGNWFTRLTTRATTSRWT